jgi:ribosome-binding protein aMBF1 (putative translation factor)
MAKTRDALKILERVTGKRASIRRSIANARMNMEVAQMIYDARTKAGLSQQQLAEMVGSRQSVIARLEDADYRGHSLSMLQRIGNAVGQRLELRFVRASRREPRRARESVRQSRSAGGHKRESHYGF